LHLTTNNNIHHLKALTTNREFASNVFNVASEKMSIAHQ